MSPALNGSSVIRHFEGSDAIKICDGITFDFYTGLPHMVYIYIAHFLIWYTVSVSAVFLQVMLMIIFVSVLRVECSTREVHSIERRRTATF